jgi:hypothetical protein
LVEVCIDADASRDVHVGFWDKVATDALGAD